MERTRLKDIKVLFFAGVNDGIIPKHGGKAGLLSESDREFLDSRQVALAPTARESMYIQRFYLYLNLTKPSRCLYLSYAQSNAQGQAQSPAYLIAMILRMYPKLVILDNPKDEISQMQMAQQATEILMEGLRKDGEQQQNDGWEGTVFLVSAVKRVERAVSSLDPGGIRGRTGEQHRKSGGGGTLRERTGKQCDGTGTVCSLCICTFFACMV